MKALLIIGIIIYLFIGLGFVKLIVNEAIKVDNKIPPWKRIGIMLTWIVYIIVGIVSILIDKFMDIIFSDVIEHKPEKPERKTFKERLNEKAKERQP